MWSEGRYSKEKYGSKHYSACSLEGAQKKVRVEVRRPLSGYGKSLGVRGRWLRKMVTGDGEEERAFETFLRLRQN